MNKDFWDKVNRLEELAGKATQGEWVSDGHGNIDSTERFYLAENLIPEDASYIAAANPAMIQEMIAKIRALEKERPCINGRWLRDYVKRAAEQAEKCKTPAEIALLLRDVLNFLGGAAAILDE